MRTCGVDMDRSGFLGRITYLYGYVGNSPFCVPIIFRRRKDKIEKYPFLGIARN